jgi:hypothetical protein
MTREMRSTILDRRALLKTGTGLLATFAGLRSGAPASARQSTPVGSPVASVEGLYAAVRLRTVKSDADVDALLTVGDRDFVPILTSVAGFIAWMGLYNAESHALTFFNVFHDKAGSDEATSKATAYNESIAKYYVDPKPQSFDGTIFASIGAGFSKDQVGKYGVFRLREVKADQDADALIAAVRDEFVPIVPTIPGFVGYWLFYSDQTRFITSFGIFDGKAGADESTSDAIDWSNAHAFYYVDPNPRVVDGTIRDFAGVAS